ncbi:MAG: TIGR02453 family protein [Alphaproteobacteria bacterium]
MARKARPSSAQAAAADDPAGFGQDTFSVLEGLKENTNRAWFGRHKASSIQSIQEPFIACLERITERLAATDLPLQGSRTTMFRVNRDVRFASDKSPSNTHVSGLLTPSRHKSEGDGFVYLRMEADSGRLRAGHYPSSPAQLKPIRQRMIDEADRFQTSVKALKKAKLVLSEEEKLSAMPRGFEAYADHPLADSLRLKRLIVSVPITRPERSQAFFCAASKAAICSGVAGFWCFSFHVA